MFTRLKAVGLGLDLPVYRQEQGGADHASLSVLLRAAFNPPKREVRTILEDINIELNPGDRLAIVGRNGSGKSTLLKVLVGAYQPSRGVLDVSGSRQALLNLSLGFSSEATLVENIILRGIAIGLRPREATKIIDEVLDFAELQEKAGDRLKTLSSGQRMRLGFAMATAVKHDLLIMDEWVGTGDAAFVAKAKARILSKVAESEVVILATHNFKLARTICNKGLLLEAGRPVESGGVHSVMNAYDALLSGFKERDRLEQEAQMSAAVGGVVVSG